MRTGAEDIVQFVSLAILARLLPLRDPGLVAFRLLFVDISRIFVSGGSRRGSFNACVMCK